MAFKIAVIGAGSIGFTRQLMHDLLSVPEFGEGGEMEIALHDINRKNLGMMEKLLRKDLKSNNLATKISTSLNRRTALEGAKYVLNLTRIGGLEAFVSDIEVPLKYGIDQCVGDTLCAGGIMYGQRNIPCILDFCHDMREVSESDVLFLSYANPNAMNTWATNQYGGVQTLGLCHGVQGGHWQIVNVIKHVINRGIKPNSKRYRNIDIKDVDIICAGINHQTWYTQILFDGEDWAGSEKLLEGFRTHPQYSREEKVRIDMLERFGYYSTESNGHLSEYVPWYRKRAKEIRKWIDMGCWIHGETGGYLRVSTEGRNWFETDFPNWLKADSPKLDNDSRGHEHASYIIESLETGRPYRGHFNTVNNSCITNLPDDAVVEVPCYVDRNGISVPQVGDLPLGCAAVCQNSINVQRLAVRAAIEGDVHLLKQAMMLDPLTGAICNPPEIWQMTDEMLLAQRQWLPQYRTQMTGIRKRFTREKKLATGKNKGAARLKTRSTKEIAKDQKAREMAARADKGNPKEAQKKTTK